MISNNNGNGDDDYDDAGDDSGDGLADSSISKANALFHELIGDDAAAALQLGQHDETSTAMSSVLGPILLRANNASSSNNNSVDHDGGNNRLGPPHLSKHRHHHQQQQDDRQDNEDLHDDTIDDEDTYMTKPREISFDMHSDDVSVLFGGNCGASTTGGMGGGFLESNNSTSYYGTSYAAQRKNRQRGLLQWQHRPSGRHTSARQPKKGVGPKVHPHAGVDSILEEIGLRPSSSKKHDGESNYNSDGFDECSGGKEKGHRKWSSRIANNRHASLHNNNNGNINILNQIMEWKTTLFERVRTTMRMKHWITVLVGIMYLSVQFRTVRNHDRETLDHLNWRFQNHRRSRPSVELSDVMRRIATGGGGGGGGRVHDRYNTNDYRTSRSVGEMGMEMNFLQKKEEEDDGLFTGDVVSRRNNMPQISRHHALERSEMLLDDDFGITNNNGNNLRGGGGGFALVDQPVQGMQRQQHSMQQLPTQQQWGKRVMGNEIQSQQQQQQQQRDDGQQNNMNNLLAGEAHPLIQPTHGLSIADALNKLGTDKLSEIDPRPQQLLSNDIIPPRFRAFADVKTAYVVGRDTPFFWHIPRSGGVVVKTMLSHCLNQTLAAEVGEMDGHQSDSVSLSRDDKRITRW